MKPAFSVIFLTTLIGAGQGLYLAYYSAEVLSLLSVLPAMPASSQGAVWSGMISLGLLVAGLIASFFHLGHPERAWRAAAMWRTSWLSREVIALPVTMALIFVYTALKYLGNRDVMIVLGNGYPVEWSTAVGFLGMLAVIGLFVCTAMIYACLKFLRQWHSPLTVLNFLLLGSASGFTLAAVLSIQTDPQLFGYYSGFAIVLTISGFVSRYASLVRNKNLRSPSTLQSAIGIHHPTIRQMAQGAMGGSFNTRAFIHTYGATVVKLARWFFLLAVFVVPVILLLLGNQTTVVPGLLAFSIQFIGLLVERWYFFIEAEHPQNVYYQMIS
ncbi:MAG: dimethyl sulfoxide reductase anchor subunit family protein [Gammaproteobacteria bacterium]